MDENVLKPLIEKGFSIENIANELKKGKTTVRYWLKKYHLKTNNLSTKEKKELKPTLLEKICPRCNFKKVNKDFYKRRSGNDLSPYCKTCTIDQTLERQKQFKLKCLEYKGLSCKICAYNKCANALEFHHLDPSKKDFNIAHTHLHSFSERIKLELDKCILVCANCHREIHAGIIVVPSGIEPE